MRVTIRTFGLLAFGFLLLASSGVQAQFPRYDIFRALLKYNGVSQGLDQLPNRRQPLDDLVLVIAGQFQENPIYEDLSRRVLNDGGAVLLAPTSPVDLTPYLPVIPGISRQTVVDGAVVCRQRDECLNGNEDQPFLSQRQLRSDLFPNLNLQLLGMKRMQVVCRRPLALDLIGEPHLLDHTLAVFPARSRDEDHVQMTSKPLLVLNRPGQSIAGRLVVTSAGRIFADSASAYMDANEKQLATDNFEFTYYMSGYLVKDETGVARRKRCLFIEHGLVYTNFDNIPLNPSPPMPPPPEVPMPPLGQLQPRIVDAFNQYLDRWQDADGPSRALLGNNSVRFPEIFRILLILGSILLLLYLARVKWQSRVVSDRPPIPPLEPAIDDPLLRQRRRALNQTEHLTDPVRQQLRFVMTQWGAPLSLFEDGSQEFPGMIDQTSEREKRLEQLKELWTIAYGSVTIPITLSRWREIEKMIDSLSQSRAEGRWQFASTVETS